MVQFANFQNILDFELWWLRGDLSLNRSPWWPELGCSGLTISYKRLHNLPSLLSSWVSWLVPPSPACAWPAQLCRESVLGTPPKCNLSPSISLHLSSLGDPPPPLQHVCLEGTGSGTCWLLPKDPFCSACFPIDWLCPPPNTTYQEFTKWVFKIIPFKFPSVLWPLLKNACQ